MENTRRLIPVARTDDLVIQEVPGETLIYDLKSHKAHCLNRAASLVWKHCDGGQTVEQVARKIEGELGTPFSSEAVWLALDQLERRRLLDRTVKVAPGSTRISRREAVRTLGITAAVALPLITSILAPTTVQAASCAGVEESCGGSNPPCCPPFQCGDGSCFDPR